MKHLVLIEIAMNNTRRNTPTQFSIVLAAEIMSRLTCSRDIAAASQAMKISAFAIDLFFYLLDILSNLSPQPNP